MKRTYSTKFALTYVRCLKCDYLYETTVGDFDIEYDAIKLGEEMHDDCFKNKKNKCKGQLVIYVSKYYVQKK